MNGAGAGAAGKGTPSAGNVQGALHVPTYFGGYGSGGVDQRKKKRKKTLLKVWSDEARRAAAEARHRAALHRQQRDKVIERANTPAVSRSSDPRKKAFEEAINNSLFQRAAKEDVPKHEAAARHYDEAASHFASGNHGAGDRSMRAGERVGGKLSWHPSIWQELGEFATLRWPQKTHSMRGEYGDYERLKKACRNALLVKAWSDQARRDLGQFQDQQDKAIGLDRLARVMRRGFGSRRPPIKGDGVVSKAWEESKHPRDPEGRFGEGGGEPDKPKQMGSVSYNAQAKLGMALLGFAGLSVGVSAVSAGLVMGAEGAVIGAVSGATNPLTIGLAAVGAALWYFNRKSKTEKRLVKVVSSAAIIAAAKAQFGGSPKLWAKAKAYLDSKPQLLSDRDVLIAHARKLHAQAKSVIAKAWTDVARTAAAIARRMAGSHAVKARYHMSVATMVGAHPRHNDAAMRYRLASESYNKAADHYDSGNVTEAKALLRVGNKHSRAAHSWSAEIG